MPTENGAKSYDARVGQESAPSAPADRFVATSAPRIDLAALREKHDPVARNLVTVWRSELLALIEAAEAAWAFLASDSEIEAHSRLNAALDAFAIEEADRG